jgi:toluene monooxygenase system protein A
VEWYSHGATPVTFCDLCQLVLSGGTPERNTAQTLSHGGRKYIFCSEPCRWIFEQEPGRYAAHKDIVKRILAGEAPANLIDLVTRYFSLSRETWGKDVAGGNYAWLRETPSVPAERGTGEPAC